MKSPQAEVLGFPNPIIGLVTFPIGTAVGALALSRTPLPGWCWTALQLGTVAGLGFVAWLVVQGVAVIGALRPWCMLVWAVTITAFWHVTAHDLAHGRLAAGAPGLILRHGVLCPDAGAWRRRSTARRLLEGPRLGAIECPTSAIEASLMVVHRGGGPRR